MKKIISEIKSYWRREIKTNPNSINGIKYEEKKLM